MSDIKLKVVIPPEVLEQMQRDIPEEDLQALLADLSKMADEGTLFDQCVAVDMETLQIDDPEQYAAVMNAIATLGHDDLDELLEMPVHDTRTLN
jgi:hypothetical protein